MKNPTETLAVALRDYLDQGQTELRLVLKNLPSGRLHVYAHPMGESGRSIDLIAEPYSHELRLLGPGETIPG
jgi:hypothetical protein